MLYLYYLKNERVIKMAKMLTPGQIAERLNLHPNTVREYLKAGVIPGIKLGRVWRIEEEDLKQFIRARKRGIKK